MSRVTDAIDAAHADGRGAFVGYLPIGYPDLDTSVEAAVALAEAGADGESQAGARSSNGEIHVPPDGRHRPPSATRRNRLLGNFF